MAALPTPACAPHRSPGKVNAGGFTSKPQPRHLRRRGSDPHTRRHADQQGSPPRPAATRPATMSDKNKAQKDREDQLERADKYVAELQAVDQRVQFEAKGAASASSDTSTGRIMKRRVDAGSPRRYAEEAERESEAGRGRRRRGARGPRRGTGPGAAPEAEGPARPGLRAVPGGARGHGPLAQLRVRSSKAPAARPFAPPRRHSSYESPGAGKIAPNRREPRSPRTTESFFAMGLPTLALLPSSGEGSTARPQR